MNLRISLLVTAALAALAAPATCAAQATMDDKAQIEALENQFQAAVNAEDLDAIMKVYQPGQDLLVFDVIPPRQYVGSDAYRKDWQGFLSGFKGPIKFTISDLSIDSDGTMGYSHSIQHITGKDAKGSPIDLTVRLTDVYRKIDGAWKVVHEHVSVPVNFDTGKPDMMSMP